MTDKLTWRSFDVLALNLQKTYPATDLLFLKNDTLLDMVRRLDIAADLPALSEDADEIKDVCYGIKIAWTKLAGKAADLAAPATGD